MTGLHPVVAVYSTFLSRAFDQVLMDVALHRLPVTFVLDRAGVTGDDGPSHNGMWDLAVFQAVPGLRIAAPRDASTLRAVLGEALDTADGPTVVRFPKGAVAADIPAVDRRADVDVLRSDPGDVLIVTVGPFAAMGLEVADRLATQGIRCTVVAPRWVKPVSEAVLALVGDHRLVVTVEDGLRAAGFGAALGQELRDSGSAVPVASFGLPRRFLGQATRQEVLAECGLTARDIARGVLARMPGERLFPPAESLLGEPVR